jgi:hypothetical protein
MASAPANLVLVLVSRCAFKMAVLEAIALMEGIEIQMFYEVDIVYLILVDLGT